MSRVIVFNPVNGDILEYHESANTPDYMGKENAILNPSKEMIAKGFKNIKVSGGVLVDKTAAEILDYERRQAEANFIPLDGFSERLNKLELRVIALESKNGNGK
jgi:hypothetical protein